MTKPTRALAAALAAGAVLVPLSGATAVTPDPVLSKPSAYPQPKAGTWKFPSGNSDGVSGSFRLKAGNKAPKVSKITYTVVEESNGTYCPPIGTVVKVKGSFTLKKAIKYDDGGYGHPWALTAKDQPYDDDEYYGFEGVKPVPVKVQNGAETWAGELAMVFDRSSDNKPYAAVTAVRFYPPTGESGFCAYYPDASSPK